MTPRTAATRTTATRRTTATPRTTGRSRHAALLAAPLAAALLAGCGSSDPEPADATAGAPPSALPTAEPGTAPGTAGDCAYPDSGAPAAVDVGTPDAADVPSGGTVTATLSTSVGDIPVELDAAAAPCTVGSFAHLTGEDYFDATSCHRITTTGIFVLQCGDPTGSGRGGPGYSFADENTDGATYDRGTVAMANAGPDTNGSQFFLVYDDSELPPAYSVFGRVTDAGLTVLDQVAAAGAEGGAQDGPPAMPVEVNDVTLG